MQIGREKHPQWQTEPESVQRYTELGELYFCDTIMGRKKFSQWTN